MIFDHIIMIMPHSDTRWSNVQRVSLEHHQLQFGMVAPTFFPSQSGSQTITNRRISTVPLDPNPRPPPQLSYTLITATASSPGCLNTDLSFTAPPPRLEYRQGNDQWKTLKYRKEVTDILCH